MDFFIYGRKYYIHQIMLKKLMTFFSSNETILMGSLSFEHFFEISVFF